LLRNTQVFKPLSLLRESADYKLLLVDKGST